MTLLPAAAQARDVFQCEAKGNALGDAQRKPDNAAAGSVSGLPLWARARRSTALSNLAGRDHPLRPVFAHCHRLASASASKIALAAAPGVLIGHAQHPRAGRQHPPCHAAPAANAIASAIASDAAYAHRHATITPASHKGVATLAHATTTAIRSSLCRLHAAIFYLVL